MGLESATHVTDFVLTNPVGGVDQKAQGDDHIRLIKTVLQNSFPGMSGAIHRTTVDSGASRNLVKNDNTSLIVCTNVTSMALATAITAATMGSWSCTVYAKGCPVTFDPNASELVNDAASITIPKGYFAFLWCDGSAYRAFIAPLIDAAGTAGQVLASNGTTGGPTWQDVDGGTY